MGVTLSEDGTYTTYGPYRDGDKPEFTEDPVEATASFDIFGDKVRDSKLKHPSHSDVECYCEPTDEEPDWCVLESDGKVADHVENLYFTFPGKPDAPAKPDVEDEVNHPKHYTGRKADLECIMFTELMPSLAANAFKYVWRCDDKGNKTEDLEKARWYLKRAHELRGDADTVLDGKMKHLMRNLIEGSDFDDWHKLALENIIEDNYIMTYNAIADLIGEPELR